MGIPSPERVQGHCTRCGYDWYFRNKEKRPKTCPKCKSPYWDKPRVRKPTVKAIGEG